LGFPPFLSTQNGMQVSKEGEKKEGEKKEGSKEGKRPS
jgi:hypothetical protein